MSEIYKITTEEGIVVITFLKPPTTSEYCSAIDDVAALELPIQNRLWDMSSGYDTSVEIDQLAIYALCLLDGPPSKVAMIAPDNHTYGLCQRQGEIRKDPGVEFRVFRTKKAALKWMKGQPIVEPRRDSKIPFVSNL